MHESAPDRASMTQVAQQEPSTVNALMEKGQHNLDERFDFLEPIRAVVNCFFMQR